MCVCVCVLANQLSSRVASTTGFGCTLHIAIRHILINSCGSGDGDGGGVAIQSSQISSIRRVRRAQALNGGCLHCTLLMCGVTGEAGKVVARMGQGPGVRGVSAVSGQI